jgi:hypothetical protein
LYTLANGAVYRRLLFWKSKTDWSYSLLLMGKYDKSKDPSLQKARIISRKLVWVKSLKPAAFQPLRCCGDCRDRMQLKHYINDLPKTQQLVLLSVVAAGQGHLLLAPTTSQGKRLTFGRSPRTTLWLGNGRLTNACAYAGALARLARDLVKVHTFYNSLGGIIGYQHKCLELLLAHGESEAFAKEEVSFHLPRGPNLATGSCAATKAVATGLEALPRMAEIYPVGGELYGGLIVSRQKLVRGSLAFEATS